MCAFSADACLLIDNGRGSRDGDRSSSSRKGACYAASCLSAGAVRGEHEAECDCDGKTHQLGESVIKCISDELLDGYGKRQDANVRQFMRPTGRTVSLREGHSKKKSVLVIDTHSAEQNYELKQNWSVAHPKRYLDLLARLVYLPAYLCL